MATQVHEILDRKTKKGRVYYLVRWEGFTADQDTWESRMDLRQDGHFRHIQAFEQKRKSADEKDSEENGGNSSSGDKSPRGRGRPPSKSPSRGRSRSVTKEPKDPNAPRRPRSTSKPRKPKGELKDESATNGKSAEAATTSDNVYSTPDKPRSISDSTVPTQNQQGEDSNNSQADDEGEDSGNPVFNARRAIPADVDNSVVAQAVEKWGKDGWFVQGFGILVVFFAILGHILISKIEETIPMSPEVKTVVSVLTNTNSFPPLISLALVLWGKNNRSLSKWIAICLVWRTAAEVILQLPDPKSLYWTVSIGCVTASDLAAFVAVCTSVGGSAPDYDVFAQTVCVVGFLLLLGADSLHYPVHELLRTYQSLRVVVMSMGTVFLSFSSMLAEV
ncbi:Aste57867_24191 [Aphanomyces stellatus]|uniref:Aste57867_24191 protein n=1 Tax=Aphanomyces stellatus TaxID=120398 RepID=A0A485LRD1_9STRA|nr:hypothetical protein As57867_024117 [Aphanomyces stellatus]VFU00833.1 Aste57867_24191 [Aphanomyces stellatus]